MDPVSKLTKTLAAFRRITGSPAPAGGKVKSQAGQAASGRTPASTVGELHAEIARRLGMVSPLDPNRRDAAVKVFLEQVLLHEFGPQLLTSQRFSDMVRSVQQTMDADPAVKAQLDDLIGEVSAR
ncbi:MAG TPA: hypothetical protein VNU48_05780 [Burkholderiaceae bacterium]|nr:hypothetical protein [Burkholderiaceae bacterium]